MVRRLRFRELSILCCLLVTACGQRPGGGLRLKIDATAAISTQTIGIDVASGKRTKHFDVPAKGGTIPPALEVGVEISPDSLGAVTVTATAGTAMASSSTTVIAGQVAELTLTLDATSTDFLTADVSGLQFGEVAIGTTSPAVLVTVTNSADITSTTLSLTSSKPEFVASADDCSGRPLNAKAACSFRVAFVPSIVGDAAGTVSIGNLHLAVTGTGVAAGALVSADSPYDFGAIGTGTTAKKTFVVSNSGSVSSGSLAVGTIAGDSPFQFAKSADGCTGATLAPGGTCSIEITYQPSAVGTHSASIRLTSPKAGKLTLGWTGQAKPATLNFTPANHNFGDVKVGDAAPPFEFMVVNNAADAIGPIVIAVSGSFAIASTGSTCEGATLASGTGCLLMVQFAPTATGFTSGSVTLSGPGLQMSAVIPVNGTGFGCTDADGDGRFVDSGDGTPTVGRCGEIDCADNDVDNWDSCSTCVDTDGDGFFTGCNGFATRYSECASDANDETKIPTGEGIGEDTDCDGRVLAVSDASGLFVAPSGLDTNPGTAAAPFLTIAAAMAKVDAQHKAIFVQKGTYAEGISPPAAKKHVGVFGGFDTSWARNIATQTVTLSPASDGVTLAAHTTLRIDGVTVQPPANDAAVVSTRGALKIANALLQAGTAKRALVASNLGTRVDAKDSVFRSEQQQDADTIVLSDEAELSVTGGSIFGSSVNASATPVSVTSSGLTATGISLYADGPGDRRGIYLTGSTARVTVSGSSLSVAGAAGGTAGCSTIYQFAGVLRVESSVLETCAAKSPAVVNVINGASTRVYSSALIGGLGSITGYAVVLRNVTDVQVVNNFITQTQPASSMYFNHATLYVQMIPSGKTAEAANNILVMNGDTASPVFIGTSTGGVRLTNNSITGGACAIRGASCAPSVNDCTGITGCSAPSGNIATACALDTSYHLLPSSPCKSVGTDPTASPLSSGPLLDIDKASRPLGAWDIGPDEVADSF